MASKSPYLVCIWRHMCMCMSFNNHLSGLVFLFSSPKKCFNESFEFLLCETHSSIFPCVGTVIDVTKDVTACKEQQSLHSTSSCVALCLFFTRCDVIQTQHVRILLVHIIARARKNLLVIERRNVQVIW